MRQFVSTVNPDKKGLIEINGKDFRYLKQVLRLSAGSGPVEPGMEVEVLCFVQ